MVGCKTMLRRRARHLNLIESQSGHACERRSPARIVIGGDGITAAR
jgi:hypothetical protein